MRFVLYLPKMYGSLLKIKYWAVQANVTVTCTFYAWQKQTFLNVYFSVDTVISNKSRLNAVN